MTSEPETRPPDPRLHLRVVAHSEIGLVRSGVARVRVEAVGVASSDGECRKS